jgi:hypothetical protein
MMTASPKSALVLAGLLGLAMALPVSAAETIEQLEAEAVRYTSMAAEQEQLGKHHKLAATSGAKGGQQARAEYHSRLARDYREKAQVYADRAQEKRDEAKRVANN